MSGLTQYKEGDRYWVPHETDAWIVGQVHKNLGNNYVEFSTAERGTIKINVKPSDRDAAIPELCGSHLADEVDNLVDLDELSEGAILHHIRKRFVKGSIYTLVGSILVAVNPFERLDIYSKDAIRAAESNIYAASIPFPHVFVTGAMAYMQMKTHGKDQSVLISGESGAGKTETTKKVLTYLASVAPDTSVSSDTASVETKILQSNPLLEALGNAKTLRNNNSSRFGKWMKVGFHRSKHCIQGCEIVNYLLEKSRVVVQTKGERNYHVFYQLLAGATEDTKQRLFLTVPADYSYLSQSGCATIEGVDDRQEFAEVEEAMRSLRFGPETQESIWNLLAAVLQLGNLVFTPPAGKPDASQVAPRCAQVLERASDLLGLGDPTQLQFSLTQKQVQMGRGSIVSIELNVDHAADTRDTLSKALYSKMFDWIVQQVNKDLKSADFDTLLTVGILDIFGFEVFDVNSFEQLCINYANEKLQFHFNEVVFNEEREMYASEGISMDEVCFVDNHLCVELIENKPLGLISLLEEECSLGANATDMSFMNKIDKAFGARSAKANEHFVKHKTKPRIFSVGHFAGLVEYTVDNFLEKSKDTLSLTLNGTMKGSSDPLIAALFPPAEETKANSKSTLGGQFRNQLIGLIAGLRKTEPQFIRCIKPNHQKVGKVFDAQLSLRQMRYSGLFEAIRIRKAGYAYRSGFSVFANSFQVLCDGLSLKRANGVITDQAACRCILDVATAEGAITAKAWVVGTTRVFFKNNSDKQKLEHHKAERVHVFAVRVQRVLAMYCAKLKAIATTNQMLWEKNKAAREASKRERMAVQIQALCRRFLVRCRMLAVSQLVELRRALRDQDVERVRTLLAEIDEEGMGGVTDTPSVFTHDLKMARVLLRLIDLQARMGSELEAAIANSDVPELNRLLALAESIEVMDNPLVVQAQQEVMRLHDKRRVLKRLLAFLQNEDAHAHSIVDTFREARRLDIDPVFMDQVWRVYERAGPKLKCRRRLRTAVEELDRHSIEQCCLEVQHIRAKEGHYDYAEPELRAARMVLRLLHMDALVSGTTVPTATNTFVSTHANTSISRSRSISNINASSSSSSSSSSNNNSSSKGNRSRTQSGSSEGGDNRSRTHSQSSEATTGGGGGGGIAEEKGSDEPPPAADKPPPAVKLWGIEVTSQRTGAKLSAEQQLLCAAVVAATNPQAAHKAKLRLQRECGSLDGLYDCIRYYKWSTVAATWNYPEAQSSSSSSSSSSFSSSSSSLSAAGLGADADGGGSLSSMPPQPPIAAQEAAESSFYGLCFREARASPHVIRSLHRDFQPELSFKGTRNSRVDSALLTAAVANIQVPNSISAQLESLSRLRDVGPAIVLPNGGVYQRGTPGKSITPSRAQQRERQASRTTISSSSSSSLTASSPRGNNRQSARFQSEASSPASKGSAVSLDLSLMMSPYSSPNKQSQTQAQTKGSGGRASAYNGSSSNSVASSAREDSSSGGVAERMPRPRSGLPVTNNMYGKQSAADLALEESRRGKNSELGKIITDLNRLSRYDSRRTWK